MSSEQLSFDFGDFNFQEQLRTLHRRSDNSQWRLGPQRCDVLLVLLNAKLAGSIPSREDFVRKVWGARPVNNSNLNRQIDELRKIFGDDYIETLPGIGYQLTVPVVSQGSQSSEILANAVSNRGERDQLEFLPDIHRLFEAIGGVLPVGSRFYCERPEDTLFQQALRYRDGIIIVKGAKQVGKTSLVGNGIAQAGQSTDKIVFTDFKSINTHKFLTLESLFLELAEMMVEELGSDLSVPSMWRPSRGPNSNFERVMQSLLKSGSTPMIWILDEVDLLFGYDYREEIFNLFRSWHTQRAIKTNSIWHQLTLVLLVSTEPFLFITDLKKSLFNVGTKIEVSDLTLEQTQGLSQKFGLQLPSKEIQRVFDLLNGHPYLTNRLFFELAKGIKLTEALELLGAQNDPFESHLLQVLGALKKNEPLCQAVQGMLSGQPCPRECFYQLRSGGVIIGQEQSAAFRCRIYEDYLRKWLL